MLHCVRQEHFTYTQTIRCVVDVVVLCVYCTYCMCTVIRIFPEVAMQRCRGEVHMHTYCSSYTSVLCDSKQKFQKGVLFYFRWSYRSSLGSVVVVYPTSPPQCVGVLVCVVCGETHQQHCLVVIPVTSSLRGTHPPVFSIAVSIW